MAEKIKLEILTPDKALFADDVDEVILPGMEGELGILPGHLPLMTTLRSGTLVAIDGKETFRWAVHAGFAEVLPGEVIVLTDAAENADEIDVDRARRALEEAEAAMKSADTSTSVEDEHLSASEAHQHALERARARLFAAGGDE